MSNMEWLQRDSEAVMHTYARFPVAIASGKGARCVDYDGKDYIDFSSGIGVNSLGFCNEGWATAVYQQLTTLQHISNLYGTSPCVEVAELLKAKTGCRRVFFGNSGAEANEGAIKAARKYSVLKYGQGRSVIVSLVNSFHGRTITTLSATGQAVFHKDFFPFTEGFLFAEANNIEDTIAKLSTEGVCALMIECVQGEGGVLPLDQAYVDAIAAYCAKQDILLLIDEVQTGVGRTGTFLCCEQYHLHPDIVTLAKGIGGGLPLGAILFFDKTYEALKPGDHASTFGGNPAICAGSRYILSSMDEAFLTSVKAKGAYFREKLLALPHVKSVSGLGLMIGIELDGVTSGDLVKLGLTQGVITLTAKAKLRLLPPLNISYADIDEGLRRLSIALGSC